MRKFFKRFYTYYDFGGRAGRSLTIHFTRNLSLHWASDWNNTCGHDPRKNKRWQIAIALVQGLVGRGRCPRLWFYTPWATFHIDCYIPA